MIKAALFALGVLVILGLLVSMVMLRSGGHKIADKSVLVFNLETQITDRPSDENADILGRLFGQRVSTLQLRAVTTALREAAQDKRISGLYLHGNLVADGYSSGYGALKELREAVQDFRKSGKPVIAYFANADNRDYYLGSVADQILLNPFGLLAFRGLAARGTFFKAAADKYGVEFTPVRHGKYKGAIEPFTRENFSPENREQIEAFIKTIWGDLLNAAAAARKISPEDLQALVDKEGLISAQTAKERGLVTELAYEGQMLDKLRQLRARLQRMNRFPRSRSPITPREAQVALAKKEHGKDKIAVLYAEGIIVDGKGEPMSKGLVAGDQFARLVRKLQQRKDVKALVLRVNSPGGSAAGFRNHTRRASPLQTGPPGNRFHGHRRGQRRLFHFHRRPRIIAEPSTITGSIGVFGMGLNVKKLANDHGITFDAVKTGALADFGTLSRPMAPEERAVLQNIIDRFYDAFVERVAQCRKLTTNRVDEIAQGRVWSGADALKVGLVDEMGGLQQAIAAAAKEAKLGPSYSVIEFPEKKAFLESLVEAFGGEKPPLARNNPGSRLTQKVITDWNWLSGFNDPQGVYARLPYDLELN